MRQPLAVLLAALVLGSCGLLEQSPSDMLSAASAKLQASKTVHIEGTGSFGIKDGISFSFDFGIQGDASLPDKTSKFTVSAHVLGQDITSESITVGGKNYVKDARTGVWAPASSSTGTPGLDPISSSDLSSVLDLKEIDRPTVDGKTTRHFSYSVDPAKIKDAMTKSMEASSTNSVSIDNVTGTGEVWVRTEDTQIVRQVVNLSFVMSGRGLVPGSQAVTNATVESKMDLHMSKFGQPIPSITPPSVRL